MTRRQGSGIMCTNVLSCPTNSLLDVCSEYQQTSLLITLDIIQI